jgi:hypothetical protein
MAAPRFCSECGERLMLKRLGSLPFRAYCYRCLPRFRPARLMLIVALASCAAIGFTIGHFTAAREPFYYLGTPIDPSSVRINPSSDDKPTHSSRSSEGVTHSEHLVISPSAAGAICGARTKSGRPCQRKVKGGGYCWQHRSKPGTDQVAPNTQ